MPTPDTAATSTPQARALEVANKIPFAHRAYREVRRAAAELKDPQLRAALEAQLQTPWLPSEAFAYAHHDEAEAMLHAAGLLDAKEPLALPPAGQGSFAAAPGGPCATGHHGYPGGLAVHEYATLLHARALAGVYQEVYGVQLDADWLTAATLWHDTLKAATLPWDAHGDCPHSEAKLAGTALHHPLGVAAAILRHLPAQLVLTIASAHAPPFADRTTELCSTVRAAGIIALGSENAIACPSLEANAKRPPLEAYVMHLTDSDFPLTVPVWSWYAGHLPAEGWKRFEALEVDGSDMAAWQRAQPARE